MMSQVKEWSLKSRVAQIAGTMDRLLVVLCFCLFATAGHGQSPQDVHTLHERYMQATLNSDEESIRRITAEDFEWELGGPIPTCKEGALRVIAQDFATQTEFSWENIVIKGDTVDCDVIISNDLMRAIGTEQVRLFPRFIYKDHLLRRIEYWKSSEDYRESHRRMMALRKWTSEEKSHLLPQIVNANGQLILTEEANALRVQLAKEWYAAGRPGLE